MYWSRNPTIARYQGTYTAATLASVMEVAPQVPRNVAAPDAPLPLNNARSNSSSTRAKTRVRATAARTPPPAGVTGGIVCVKSWTTVTVRPDHSKALETRPTPTHTISATAVMISAGRQGETLSMSQLIRG